MGFSREHLEVGGFLLEWVLYKEILNGRSWKTQNKEAKGRGVLERRHLLLEIPSLVPSIHIR